jgi:hypothetical protein
MTIHASGQIVLTKYLFIEIDLSPKNDVVILLRMSFVDIIKNPTKADLAMFGSKN